MCLYVWQMFYFGYFLHTVKISGYVMVFLFFKLLFGFIFMQALCSMKDITLASQYFVPTLHHNWMIDFILRSIWSLRSFISWYPYLFLHIGWEISWANFFFIMRPVSQTNLTKHMAKNKQTSSLIYGSVTYDLHYKCLFHILLSMLCLVFSIQTLTCVFPGSADENHYFPPFPLFVLPCKRDKIRNIHVSTSILDTATIERHSCRSAGEAKICFLVVVLSQCKWKILSK
jgi:hypothetical protein